MQNLLDDRRLLLPILLTAVAVAVGSVLIIVLTDDASSGGSGSSGSPASAPSAGGATKVDITDFKYDPETITVKAGSSVTFVNNDSAPHTATADDAFDTGNLGKGDSKAVKVDKAGSFAYVCEFHAFMKGTVVVE